MLTAHDVTLLLLAAGAVGAVILLIAQFKVHPFVAVMLAALGLGLASGEKIAQVLTSFTKGFGDTLAGVGMVLALGAMFGSLLADSRGAERIAAALVGARGPRFAPWAMAALAMLLGLPVFFETGVVMMMPIIVAVGLQLKGRLGPGVSPFLAAGLPAIAGLSVVHGLVPPHPGPLVAIAALNADLGRTLLLGLIVAVPTVILAGPVFALWAARHASAEPPAGMIAAELERGASGSAMPGATITVLTILFPIALMLGKAAADLTLPAGNATRNAFDFAGAPVVALLAGTILAMFTFGYALGRSRQQVSRLLGELLPPIAAILLVIGAGGALKQTLVDIGLGPTMARAAGVAHVTPLLLGWVTAVLIRLATGSATVATVTAAGLMAAAAASSSHLNTALLALSIGAGSLFFSHVNDAGFWLVKGYLGLSLPDMFKTWSLLETIISVTGLVLVLLLSLVV